MPKTKTPTIDSSATAFRLELKESKIHRWGLFSAEPIPAKRKIIEYTGERISRTEIKKRAGKKLNYIFTIDRYFSLIVCENCGSNAQRPTPNSR